MDQETLKQVLLNISGFFPFKSPVSRAFLLTLFSYIGVHGSG